MDRLWLFSVRDTDIRNFDFLSDKKRLEELSIVITANKEEHTAYGLPSFKNSPSLKNITLDVDVKDLDFIAENQKLAFVSVYPNHTNIEDISGLKNKPELVWLSLGNVDCADMSVLLELPALEKLEIIGTIIPDDIRDKLKERDVEITNLSTEDYEKKTS